MTTFNDLISERELADKVGLTIWGLRAWRKRNYGPPAGKLGQKVVYRVSDVEQFLSALSSATQ